jgi:putative membrane-bound dehydrogenase-like protein
LSKHSLQPRTGFTAELVAAEPLVESPVAFDWAPDGALWVVEMRDYPLGMDNKGQPGGRVVRLMDADGDGRFDRSDVFLDGLLFPTSVMSWRNGVLIACAPDILYAEDADGDGRADTKQVLFTGFGEANPQHRVNGLRWGLDNWVYCANGDFAPARTLGDSLPPDPTARGFSPSQAEDLRRLAIGGAHVKSLTTGATYDIRNRDLRIRPDDGSLDPQAGQSQFGRDRDDWGNWFGCHHATPMWHYALDDHYLRRNPHVASPSARVEAPRSITFALGSGRRTGTPRSRQGNAWTSGASVMVYRDTLFGPDFAENWFACEPVHNLVHREVLIPDGVTFTSRRAADEEFSEFLASDDPMFTPVSIRTGPDGALWVADMHRLVLEHPHWLPAGWETSVDVRAGEKQGRIYRIFPAGKQPRAWPRLDRLESAGLVELLDSPNGWLRDKVQQLLIERQDRTVLKELTAKATSGKMAVGRLHALCTLDGLQALTPEVLTRTLSDSHPAVRRHAVRLSDSAGAPWPQVEAALLELVSDRDATVRLQLAYTLGSRISTACGRAQGKLLLQDANDPYISAAALSSLTPGNLATVVETVLATSGQVPPSLVQALLQSAMGFGEPRAAAALVDRLARPPQTGFGSEQFIALAGWLDALDQANRPLSQWANEAEEPLRGSLNRLAAVFEAARNAAGDPAAPGQDRMSALRLLSRGTGSRKKDLDVLADLLTPRTDEALQNAAASALARLDDPLAAERLFQSWKGFTPKLRFQALDVLLSTSGGSQAVLQAASSGRILTQDVPLPLRQRLLEHPSGEVRRQAIRAFTDRIDPDREKVVQAYVAALTLDGDPGRGLKLFTKNCAACHRVGMVGQAVGPDLAMVRDKPREWFLPALFDPSRMVDARYLNYVAVTKQGTIHTGVMSEEGGNSITLVGTNGEAQVLLRTNLEELVSTGKSAMPDGLEKELNKQDVADVIAWLKANQEPASPVRRGGRER